MELFLARDDSSKQLHMTLAALRAREPKFATSMVVRERSQPRATFIHLGGDFTRKGELVTPGVPGVLSVPRRPRANRYASIWRAGWSIPGTRSPRA